MSIHIYVNSEKFIGIMKNIPVEGVTCDFHVLKAGIKINMKSVNVFIVKKLPSITLHDAKYVLCSDNPNELTDGELEKLFDIWPERLTPRLLTFCFRKLIRCIRTQLKNTKEEQEHQKRILEMAQQDYLTGLATRWYLQEYVESLKDNENITCIYFDLDNFKLVNDTFGHQAGDRALAATAEMMQREFDGGFCARMGGDEFMIVLPGVSDTCGVAEKVSAFMTKLTEYYAGTRTMKMLSVSAGISGGAGKTIDRLIHESDTALYKAKKKGKACCEIYSPSMEKQH